MRITEPRLAVIGAGLAGTLLAWRMIRDRPQWRTELFRGPGEGATDVSGGLVRAFEPDPGAAELATAALAELRADPRLRHWAGYREIGSCYACLDVPAEDLRAAVDRIERSLPGSARLVDADGLRAAGLAGVPGSALGVLERHAGYISPAGLRDGVLGQLGPLGVVRPEPVLRVEHAGDVLRCVTTAGTHEYDRVVVATGRWTPQLLRDSGFPADDLRVKHVQYGVYRAEGRLPDSFIDDTSGLYGRRRADRREVLLGVPSDHWLSGPDGFGPIADLQRRTEELAAIRLPGLRLGPLLRIASGADCYHDPPVLALRRVPAGPPGLYTFTGGSGGAAKYLLAAGAAAARQLGGDHITVDSGAVPGPPRQFIHVLGGAQ